MAIIRRRCPENYNPEIKVENFFDGADKAAFEYYINQIHEMDKFVGELVKYLQKGMSRQFL